MPEKRIPPKEFVDQVKDALEHLYDPPYLQRHPLLQGVDSGAGHSTKNAGQHLRNQLLAAIEDLNPGMDVPFRAPHARLYSLLHLRYVEGMTIQEVAKELAISIRQVHRGMRRGEESVAAIMWSQHLLASPQEPKAIQLSSIEAEVARLEPSPRPIDICSQVERARNEVEQLARRHTIGFQVKVPLEPVIVATDPVIAHQILVTVFSYAIQHAQPGTIYLTLEAYKEGSTLVLRYTDKNNTAIEGEISSVVTRLMDRLGWQVEQADDEPENLHVITILMAGRGPTILVVDDNEGLVELLQRYLTGHACRVTAAASGPDGLRLAQELLPNAIILDVMMPGMNGWEFLQKLRTYPETAPIPVIICSIFNDPELAYSLGASLFLPKPVSRDEVVARLRELGVL